MHVIVLFLLFTKAYRKLNLSSSRETGMFFLLYTALELTVNVNTAIT